MGSEVEKTLTPTQRFAAFLDARGFSPKEIGEKLNINPTTVSNFRAMPHYINQREAYQDEGADKLEPILTRVRLEALDLHRATFGVARKALEQLQEALDATLPDSNEPNWVVRIAAIQAVQKMVGAPSPLIAKALAAAEDQNGAAPAGPSVVKLEISVTGSAGTEEVAEDGTWEEGPDGNGDADTPAVGPAGAVEADAGASGAVVVLPDCTCSNPTQWLEAACPLHGAEVRERLTAEGLEVHE